MKRFWFNCDTGIRVFKTFPGESKVQPLVHFPFPYYSGLPPPPLFPPPHCFFLGPLVLDLWTEGRAERKFSIASIQVADSKGMLSLSIFSWQDSPPILPSPHPDWAPLNSLCPGNATPSTGPHLASLLGNTSSLLCLRLPCPFYGQSLLRSYPECCIA